MKKLVSVLLAVMLVFAAIGCGKKETLPVTGNVRLAGLKGPTSMGLVKLVNDAEASSTKNTYDFTMATAADEITPALLKGELDIAAVPANLASVLYNKSEGKMRILGVCTLGVVYIVEKGTTNVKSVKDLKGKTIYATGKGTTPEFALTYILAQNGLDINKDVTMEWKSEPTEVVSTIGKMDSAVAMIPQPFVTVAGNQLSDLTVALDLTKEWDNTGADSKFVTAVLVANADFVANNEGVVKTFLEEYKASAEWINSNAEEGADLVEKYGIVKAAIAKKAIPNCSIVCVTGDDMKKAVSGYLNVLFGQKPESVGGKLPDDAIYYISK